MMERLASMDATEPGSPFMGAEDGAAPLEVAQAQRARDRSRRDGRTNRSYSTRPHPPALPQVEDAGSDRSPLPRDRSGTSGPRRSRAASFSLRHAVSERAMTSISTPLLILCAVLLFPVVLAGTIALDLTEAEVSP
jgi:hypothetical protein